MIIFDIIRFGNFSLDERKEIYLGNFSLDSSCHLTGDAAFTSATPQNLQHSRANTDSHNTQNTKVKNQVHFSLCKMALSPARRAPEELVEAPLYLFEVGFV
jgi:hypothetical protein